MCFVDHELYVSFYPRFPRAVTHVLSFLASIRRIEDGDHLENQHESFVRLVTGRSANCNSAASLIRSVWTIYTLDKDDQLGSAS